MSAGFKVRDVICWGTNGAIEAFVEVLANAAADRLGTNDPLAIYLRECGDGFYGGFVVLLDDWVKDEVGRQRLVELFDHASEDILRRKVFTEYGEAWLASEVRSFVAELAAF